MHIWKILPPLQPSASAEAGIPFFKAAADLNRSGQHFSVELDNLVSFTTSLPDSLFCNPPTSHLTEAGSE